MVLAEMNILVSSVVKAKIKPTIIFRISVKTECQEREYPLSDCSLILLTN